MLTDGESPNRTDNTGGTSDAACAGTRKNSVSNATAIRRHPDLPVRSDQKWSCASTAIIAVEFFPIFQREQPCVSLRCRSSGLPRDSALDGCRRCPNGWFHIENGALCRYLGF